MRRNSFTATCLISLSALLLFSTGCSLFSSKNAALKDIQGHWVDVNGNTTLDFKGDKLTISFSSYHKTVRIKVESEYSTKVIKPAKEGEHFDLLSDITIKEDGLLTAYEEVLDAEGHSYRFVREEALEKEKEIIDLSEDLPKSIGSDEIESFSLSFSNTYGSYDLDEHWESGYYSWEIEKDGDRYEMSFRISGDSYIVLDFKEAVDEAYVKGLAALIKELKIPENNGYYKKNNVSRPGYSFYVTYGSGEKLTIRAEGDAASTCIFDLNALLSYAEKQPLRSVDQP